MTELGIELNDTSVELGIEPSAEAISYNGLVNKPQINSVTLQGNKTSSDLGLVDEDTLDNYYTKTQVDTSLNLKADRSTTYTKTETDTLLGNKVDKVSGKGLSQNDFTDTLKNKLDGIEQGAEVNVQADWNENDSTKDDFIKNKPTIPTLDNYYTKTETDSKISSHHDTTKQDTLVSGTNIKTINNQTILGPGNIDIQGGVQSVNGKTGVVTLDATDVGALPSSTAIPSKTSDLTNDSGFITSASLSPYRTSANQDLIDNQKADKSTTYTKSETDTLLGGKVDTSTLANYSTTSQMNTAIEGHHDTSKQDVISDLATIRQGASLGATSIQPNDNVSELVNDAGYLTSHQSLANYYNKGETDTLLNAKQDNLPSVVNDRYLHTNNVTGALEWAIQGGIVALTTQEVDTIWENN